MTHDNEKNRLEAVERRSAVSSEYHRHDDAHAISLIRAKKHVPALANMVAECGVTGMIHALGSAIMIAVRRGVWMHRDPYATVVNADRVKRFASTLRRRCAAKKVSYALAPDYDFDDEQGAYSNSGRRAA